MNDNLDTARDILEKALEPLFASFSGAVEDFEQYGWQKMMRADKDTPFEGEVMIDHDSVVKWVAAREEIQKKSPPN